MNVRRSFSQPPQTLVDLLRQREDEHANEVLYRFLRPGSATTTHPDNQDDLFHPQILTYSDLDRRAKEIAAWLLGRVRPGDRVVLAFPPGCEYIVAYFGCLYAGVIAVPAYPPRRNQRDQRLHAIIADADVHVALTTEGLLESVTDSMSDANAETNASVQPSGCLTTSDAPQVAWHSIQSIPNNDGLSDQWDAPKINAASLAFLQYTSGSTGTPKGVMVTHGNLIHNQKLIQSSFQSDHRDSLIGWLPLHHDMGLIGNVMHPLHLGGSLTFMSPIDFLQKPARWLQAISHYKGTIGGGPNFAFRLCAEQISDEELQGVDLSLWRVAFNGAEPIDADVLDQFAERFQSVGFEHKQFSPCYGMAETTLLITSKVREQAVRLHPNQDGSKTWVGCGAAREDMDIRIVDPERLTEMLPGQTGEIWINGPSVAAGYWKKPEQTQQTFEANIAGLSRPYLRTGDLGWIDPNDNELFVTGRCKDLIIVRGANYYPQDIEQSSESSHAACAVGGCAAFSVQRDGEECLVVAQEVRRSARRSMDAIEVINAIRDRVFDEHQLPPVVIVLLRPSALPKTTSGKVQRGEAQRQFLAGELRQEHSWDIREVAELVKSFDDNFILPQETADLTSRLGASPGSGTKQPGLAPKRLTQSREICGEQPEGWTPTGGYELIATWLVEQVANLTKLPAETIDRGEPLSRYGLNSVGAVRLAGELSQWLGREVPPTLAYEYPTIDTLAHFLSGDETETTATRSQKPSRETDHDDIAIVGIGCRFPMADSPESFWDALMSGTDAISDRAEHPNRFSKHQTDLDKAYFRAGYLSQVDQFDAAFFGISPREADAIDPQHRLLLETTYEAIEDAGIPIERLRGERVGVFVGSSHQDYLRLGGPDSVSAYSASGNSMSMAAGRLSYTFDFRGPSLTIDTACSSSLVATHQAIRSLRSGECDYAVAGGVNLILSDEATESFAKAGMLSPTGVCRTFDDNADGFVRGEGVGMILLRPLKEAIASGDRIYGVLKGSTINQDGRTNGLTAPSRIAQTELIQEAVEDAGLVPSDIEYVEAHGTGTSLGDPIELRAIREALRSDDIKNPQPLTVGSVKANMGHLEAAAGIAGLIKVALSMRHGSLPPQIHFEQPNTRIDWNETIDVPVRALAWGEPTTVPRRAGVSSFGFSGTNAHVIIEQYTATQPTTTTLDLPSSSVLVASAKSEVSLQRRMEQIDTVVEQATDPYNLASLANTLAARRSHHRYRAAKVGSIVAESLRDSNSETRSWSDRATIDAVWSTGVAKRIPHVDFYFTGQGGVQPGAGSWLYENKPAFAEHFDALSVIYASVTGDQLRDRLWGDEGAWMNTLVQPAIYSLQMALARFWQSLGVRIHRVVGHSLGEYAAAAVAGVFSVEDGMRLVSRRAELAGALSVHGGMLAVFSGEADLRSTLNGVDEVWDLAVVNGPRQTVIAGLPDALERLATRLKSGGIPSRTMSTTHGFHSRLIEPMLDKFESFAATIAMQESSLPMVSSQTGLLVGGEVSTPAYWRGNLRSPVRFDKALHALASESESEVSDSLGIEIGAGSTLASLSRASEAQLSVLPGLQIQSKAQTNFDTAIAKLYLHGVDFDWARLFGKPALPVTLPNYPFDRQRHWIVEPETALRHSQQPSGRATQDFPGQQLELATDDTVYQTTMVADSYLADHKVAGSVIFPAAGFIWWAYQAAKKQSSLENAREISLADFKISQAIRLQTDERRLSQLVLSSATQQGIIASKQDNDWQHHASWRICDPTDSEAAFEMPLSQSQLRLLQSRCIDSHYDELAEAGLKYGPTFRCIRELNASGKWAEAIVEPPSDNPQMVGMLDSCFQVIASLGQHWGRRTWVPVAADRIDFHRSDLRIASSKLRVQAHLTNWDDETATADVWILSVDEGESRRIAIKGLRLQATTPIQTEGCLFEEVFVPHLRNREPNNTIEVANATNEKIPINDWLSNMPSGTHEPLPISDALETIAGAWVGEILTDLGLKWKVSHSFTSSQWMEQAGIVPTHQRLMNRILDIGCEQGWLTKSLPTSDSGPVWTIVKPPSVGAKNASRLEGQNEFILLDRCAAATARILRTGEDPLPLLFPRDGQVSVADVYRDSVGGRRLNHLAALAVQRLVDPLSPGRGLRILEIGGGTGSTTASVLPLLPAKRCRYDFTDIAPGFFISAKERFKQYDFVDYQVLNIENDPANQGFESKLGSYDLIIAANVLHATADMKTTTENIRRLLSDDGQLVVLEGTRPARWLDLTFGLTPGWWRFTDTELRQDYPLLSCEGWSDLLTSEGFDEPTFVAPVGIDEQDASPSHVILAAVRPTEAVGRKPSSDTSTLSDERPDGLRRAARIDSKRLAILCLGSTDLADKLLQRFAQLKNCEWESVRAVPIGGANTGSDVESICRSAKPTDWVFLLDEVNDETGDPAIGIASASSSVLEAVQAIESWQASLTESNDPISIRWVQRSSRQSIVADALWSFWRTVVLEFPQWQCLGVQLDRSVDDRDAVSMLVDEFCTPITDSCELRLDDEGRHVRQLSTLTPPLVVNAKVGRELSIRERGSLDGLNLRTRRRRKPGAKEIEIRIESAGVNFRDVLNVLGSYPGNPPLGAECVGVISAIGSNVNDLAVGDRVVAIAADTFADFVAVPASTACLLPSSIDATEIATLPVAFLTASAALERVAKLKAGDTVLIHSAAGGVGMAAVQIAMHTGATVLATASVSKNEILRELGVDWIGDSRSLGFAEKIMEFTDGRGVDVILNSLGEDFIDENLASISASGCYVDISLNNPMIAQRITQAQPTVRYSTLDLSKNLASQADSIRDRLTDMIQRVEQGDLHPLPHRVFDLSDCVEAFEWMRDGINVGKAIIRCNDVKLSEHGSASTTGVHVLTGGFGGLGWLTIDYLIENGVTEIVLLTRRDPTDREAMILNQCQSAGANVRVERVELDEFESVDRVLSKVRESGTPITAVYHLAGVLQDAVIAEQNEQSMRSVLEPKASAAWNLHQATLEDPLERFVLFSSMSAWLGSPGQANHATANGFLDALAQHRRKMGRPAISIGWGPWARVGSAAKRERIGKGDFAGIGMLMPDEGIELLDMVLRGQVLRADFSCNVSSGLPAKLVLGRLMVDRLPDHLQKTALFIGLSDQSATLTPPGQQKIDWVTEFANYPKEEQVDRVMNHLRAAIARSLSMKSADAVPIDSPLFDLGMDSLTSLELVNHLQSSLGVRISTVELFNFPDVRSLAGRLVDLMLPAASERPAELQEVRNEEHEPAIPTNSSAQNDNETSPMKSTVATPMSDVSQSNEVAELLDEIGDLTDQFDRWGVEQ